MERVLRAGSALFCFLDDALPAKTLYERKTTGSNERSIETFSLARGGVAVVRDDKRSCASFPFAQRADGSLVVGQSGSFRDGFSFGVFCS